MSPSHWSGKPLLELLGMVDELPHLVVEFPVSGGLRVGLFFQLLLELVVFSCKVLLNEFPKLSYQEEVTALID